MPRGYPDYRLQNYSSAIAITDLGEVVRAIARVRSYNSTGRVLFFDHYEEGLFAWQLSSFDPANRPVLDTSVAMIAPASCKMPVSLGVGVQNSAIYKYLPLYEAGWVGLDFSMYGQMTEGVFDVVLQHFNGSNIVTYSIEFDWVGDRLTVYDTVMVSVLSPIPAPGSLGWINYKLVVDLANGQYRYLLYNDTALDLSAYSGHAGGATANSVLLAGFEGRGDFTVVQTIRIGHAIVTADEI